jgi:hypothetical protein
MGYQSQTTKLTDQPASKTGAAPPTSTVSPATQPEDEAMLGDKKKEQEPATPPDDEVLLTDKKKELDALKSKINEDTAASNTVAAEIKFIEARLVDLRKASAGFKDASAQLQTELSSYHKVIASKLPLAEAGIKDHKEVVDKIIAAAKQTLKDQSTEVDALGGKAAEALQTCAEGASDAAGKQASYADLKNTQKDIEGALKEIKSLIDQASAAETQGNMPAMYFLLKEGSELANVTIPEPAAFESKLKLVQADAETAKQRASAEKADFDKKTQDHQDAQKELKSATAGLRADVLTQLKKVRATGGTSAKAYQSSGA